MVSSAVVLYSNTISTTDTNLSGAITSISCQELPKQQITFENLPQYSLGPKYNTTNITLAEGVVVTGVPMYTEYRAVA